MFFLRAYLNKQNLHPGAVNLFIHHLLRSVGWAFKSFVQTPFHVFAAGTYHDFTNTATRIPFDTLMYERAADNGHYIDEYTVLRGIALSFGRVAGLLLAIFLVGFVGLNWLFLIAAAASLFLGLLK